MKYVQSYASVLCMKTMFSTWLSLIDTNNFLKCPL